jgi:hypothetical protein
MPDDDAPIDDATYSLAVAAQHLLTMTEARALQHGPEAARGGLLVAFTVFGERTVGRDATLEELNRMIAALLENDTVADAVSKWLH